MTEDGEQWLEECLESFCYLLICMAGKSACASVVCAAFSSF